MAYRILIVDDDIELLKMLKNYFEIKRYDVMMADNARNYSQCDSLLLGSHCGAHTFPYMDIHNETAVCFHILLPSLLL